MIKKCFFCSRRRFLAHRHRADHRLEDHRWADLVVHLHRWRDLVDFEVDRKIFLQNFFILHFKFFPDTPPRMPPPGVGRGPPRGPPGFGPGAPGPGGMRPQVRIYIRFLIF